MDERDSSTAFVGAGVAVGSNGIVALEHCNNHLPSIAVYDSPIGTGWNYISVVCTDKRQTIYLNGTHARTGLASTKTQVKAPYRIGGGQPFTGSMDEVRVSGVPRSANWIWAEYLNMGSNTVFNSYGKMMPPSGTLFLFQ